MSNYHTTRGTHVRSSTLNLSPTLGTTISAAGTTYSPVIELSNLRTVTAALLITSVSTADTVDVTIETSNDGTNYWTICTFTQGTDATVAATERKSCTAAGRYLRAKYVAAGSGVSIVCALSAEAV